MSALICEVGENAPSACLCPVENPNRLVSLWGMLQVHAYTFVTLLDHLGELEQWCVSGTVLDRSNPAGQLLGLVRSDCEDLELVSSTKQVYRIIDRLRKDGNLTDNDLKRLVSELRTRIEEDLEETVFFRVSSDKVRLCFNRVKGDALVEFQLKTPEELFGADVIRNFASTRRDVDAACRCLFTDNATACVFHLMRVLEIGLTALGKVFDVSLAHTNWAPAIDDIARGIKDMSQDPKWKALPDWKEQQEFYSQAASHFRIMKDAWRNYTAHARGYYDPQEALVILIGVQAFMQKLATRLSE